MSFQRVVVIDWEASGIPSDLDMKVNYENGPQGIDLGAVVLETDGWKRIGEFSSRVKFLFGMEWNPAAERVHGIRMTDACNGPSPHTVMERFDSFLAQFFHRDRPILMAGQNPSMDRWFTHQLFWLAGHRDHFPWRFHARMLDTFSLGYLCWGCTTGNELYERVCGVQRTQHTAYEDACLGATVIREAFNVNRSTSEDPHDPVSDREIHSYAPAGNPSVAPSAWDGDDHFS